MARAMARDRAMARTTDRPRLRAMVSSRAKARALECVFGAQTVFAGGPNLT